MNLYEISETIQRLMDAVENDEISMEEAADSLEGLDGMLEDKIDDCVKYLRVKQTEAEAYRAEKDLFAAKQKSAENAAERMKSYIRDALDRAGREKVRGLFSVSLGKPSVKCVVDADKLPDQFVELVRKPLTTEVKKRLEAGEAVQGAELVDGEKRLTIR